jgi:hypothetical protein
MEAALGRKATKASGIPLRKAIQGVTNRTLVDIRARRVLTRRNRAVTLAVTAAGRAASVAAEATASVAVAATASAVVAATAPAADTGGSAVSAADTDHQSVKITYLAQRSRQNASIFLGVNGDADTPACTSFSRSVEHASRGSATRAMTSARSVEHQQFERLHKTRLRGGVKKGGPRCRGSLFDLCCVSASSRSR